MMRWCLYTDGKGKQFTSVTFRYTHAWFIVRHNISLASRTSSIQKPFLLWPNLALVKLKVGIKDY